MSRAFGWPGVLAALLAVVVLGCGGDSPSAATPTTSATITSTAATTTPTAAVATVVDATTTPTAGTTATSTPRAAPANIRIVGSDAFVAQVEAALFLLADSAPETLAWVHGSVKTVLSVPFPTSSAQDVIDGVVRVAQNQAFVPGYSPSEQVIWLAAELVREACFINLYQAGRDYYSQVAAVTCLEEELAVLERIDERGWFARHVEGLIEERTESAGNPDVSTATSTVITATPSPTSVPEGIRIFGADEFVTQVESALQLLEERAPDALERVRQGIARIVSVPAGSGMDVFTKTFQVGWVTAFAPGFDAPQQVIWLAGTIVHDACHSNLYAEGRVYYGKEGELTCLREQLEVLDLIDDETFFSNYIEELIEGADDPENQYWNDPNRHW